jgi:hypothetical protein
VAAKLMGRKPDILLHRSGNWKQGRNTGTLGVDASGKPIPSGQFGHFGTILKYKPDPSISESAP